MRLDPPDPDPTNPNALQQLPRAAIAQPLIRRSTALAEAALTNNVDEHSEISARRIKWRAAARGAN